MLPQAYKHFFSRSCCNFSANNWWVYEKDCIEVVTQILKVFKVRCPFKTFNSLPKCNKLHAHIYTFYTFLLWLSSNTLHIPLKFKTRVPYKKRKEKLKWTAGFQYNVPAPRAKECCIELGLWRWEFIDPAAEVYHDPAFSKKLEAVVLMLCGCRLWGLEGPCVSQTAGDCGELHAMGSLELGLCSGGSSPFFIIFFSFDLLFWNQILTWKWWEWI